MFKKRSRPKEEEQIHIDVSTDDDHAVVKQLKSNTNIVHGISVTTKDKQQETESKADDIITDVDRTVDRNIEETTSNKKNFAAPMKSLAFIKTTTVFDYQANICKDYKLTGFCGFGDNCIFLHDRGDYKTGAQLEKEFIESQKKQQKEVADGKQEDNSESPRLCGICKQELNDPVVTKCHHCFCRKCAMNRFSKVPTCATCGKNSMGIFNAYST